MRLIDADALYDFFTEQIDKETGAYSKGRNAGINIARSALHDKTITPTIALPINDPLTLEQLREMDDVDLAMLEIKIKPENGQFRICECSNGEFLIGLKSLPISEYGETWLAYRRKPMEGTP